MNLLKHNVPKQNKRETHNESKVTLNHFKI